MAYGLLIGAIGDCRFIGLLIDGNWTGFHLFALGFEWVTAVLALILWWRLRQRAEDPHPSIAQAA